MKPFKKHLKSMGYFYIKFYYPLWKIFTTIITIILVLLVFTTITIYMAGKRTILDYSIFVIESESMLPQLEKGELIFVRKTNNYKVGDIISFYTDSSPDKPFTHRIVDKQEGYYITQGDNNQEKDPFRTDDSEIIGKVIETVPNAGKIVLFLRSVEGIILFIIVPASLIIGINIADFMRFIQEAYQKSKSR